MTVQQPPPKRSSCGRLRVRNAGGDQDEVGCVVADVPVVELRRLHRERRLDQPGTPHTKATNGLFCATLEPSTPLLRCPCVHAPMCSQRFGGQAAPVFAMLRGRARVQHWPRSRCSHVRGSGRGPATTWVGRQIGHTSAALRTPLFRVPSLPPYARDAGL